MDYKTPQTPIVLPKIHAKAQQIYKKKTVTVALRESRINDGSRNNDYSRINDFPGLMNAAGLMKALSL